MFDFIKNISLTEWAIVILILVVLFGGKAIARGIARKSGETVKEAKKIKKEFTDATEDDDKSGKGGGKIIHA